MIGNTYKLRNKFGHQFADLTVSNKQHIKFVNQTHRL